VTPLSCALAQERNQAKYLAARAEEQVTALADAPPPTPARQPIRRL